MINLSDWPDASTKDGLKFKVGVRYSVKRPELERVPVLRRDSSTCWFTVVLFWWCYPAFLGLFGGAFGVGPSCFVGITGYF